MGAWLGKMEKFYCKKGYTPEWAAEFADISVDQIYRLAEEIAHAEIASYTVAEASTNT